MSWSTTRCYLVCCWCMLSISSMFYLPANVVSLAASVSGALFWGLLFALMGSRPIENLCCASSFCPFLFLHYLFYGFICPPKCGFLLSSVLLVNDRRQLQEPFFTGLKGRLHVSTPTDRPPILTSVSVGLRL